MQFTDEVSWSTADFVFGGFLILSVGVPCELAVRQTANAAYRAATGLGATEPPGPLGLLLLNGFFVALFAGSALLFGKAAKEGVNDAPSNRPQQSGGV